jgi:endonuclease/exonuclease/phosphatase family metal-dependent hydrolase
MRRNLCVQSWNINGGVTRRSKGERIERMAAECDFLGLQEVGPTPLVYAGGGRSAIVYSATNRGMAIIYNASLFVPDGDSQLEGGGCMGIKFRHRATDTPLFILNCYMSVHADIRVAQWEQILRLPLPTMDLV